jgi:hypothetical protein
MCWCCPFQASARSASPGSSSRSTPLPERRRQPALAAGPAPAAGRGTATADEGTRAGPVAAEGKVYPAFQMRKTAIRTAIVAASALNSALTSQRDKADDPRRYDRARHEESVVEQEQTCRGTRSRRLPRARRDRRIGCWDRSRSRRARSARGARRCALSDLRAGSASCTRSVSDAWRATRCSHCWS